MKNLLPGLLLFMCCWSFAQKKDSQGKINIDTNIYFSHRAFFYIDDDRSFFKWKLRPDSIEFVLGDRWGKIEARSKDKDFAMGSIIEEKRFMGCEKSFWCWVILYLPGGEKKSYNFSVYCTGWYRFCG